MEIENLQDIKIKPVSSDDISALLDFELKNKQCFEQYERSKHA